MPDANFSKTLKRHKPLLLFLLKILIGVACIAFIYKKNLFNVSIISYAIRVSPLYVLAGFLVVLTMIFLGITRWYLVMRNIGVRFSYTRTIAVGLIGIFFATFAPGGVISDIMRSYYSSMGKRFSTESVTAVIIDRGGALLGQLITVILFGWWLFHRIKGSVFETAFFFIISLSLLALLIIGSFYLNLWPNLLTFLGRFEEFARRIQKRPLALIIATLIGALNSLLLGTSLYIFAWAIAGHVPGNLNYFLFAGPFIAISLTIPLTPAGIGTGQIAGLLLFNSMSDHTIKFGAEIVTLVQLSWMAVGILGVLIFIFYRKHGEIE